MGLSFVSALFSQAGGWQQAPETLLSQTTEVLDPPIESETTTTIQF